MERLTMNTLATFDHRFHAHHIQYLCGIDEAGRGPLAGPVVAAAVILPVTVVLQGLDDSKRLSAAQREALFDNITDAAVSYAFGQASESEIDRMNILQATFLAMKRAVEGLVIKPQYILVDGRDFPQFVDPSTTSTIPGCAVTGGDRQSQCVAAASVLAKVHRDRYMVRMAERYPDYGFERHKGYGTAEHRRHIQTLGYTPLHRKSFLKRISDSNSFE